MADKENAILRLWYYSMEPHTFAHEEARLGKSCACGGGGCCDIIEGMWIEVLVLVYFCIIKCQF